MYSQHDEERIILANTPPVGRCLDLGAFSATTFSNVRALIERGWSAVLVEPSAVPFAGLVEAYRHNDKITLVNVFAGDQFRLRRIQMTQDALTTADPVSYEKWKAVGQFREVIAPEVPLIQILLTAGGPYNFINIDTEGSSFSLLKQINLKQFDTSLVCIEHDGKKEELRQWFNTQGFAVIDENGGNMIAKRVS